MPKTLDERLAALSPERRAKVAEHRRRMLAEVGAWRLRELREQRLLSQAEVADSVRVSQRRISGIESGDVEKTQVGTLRRYAQAVGGELRVEVQTDGDRFPIA
jgi:predicted XRE-type DNA-binding protein